MSHDHNGTQLKFSWVTMEESGRIKEILFLDRSLPSADIIYILFQIRCRANQAITTPQAQVTMT